MFLISNLSIILKNTDLFISEVDKKISVENYLIRTLKGSPNLAMTIFVSLSKSVIVKHEVSD